MKSLLLLFLIFSQTTDNKVIICTGKNSHAYHKTINCHGLENCHWHTDAISKDSAISLGRKPCKYCYR